MVVTEHGGVRCALDSKTHACTPLSTAQRPFRDRHHLIIRVIDAE